MFVKVGVTIVLTQDTLPLLLVMSLFISSLLPESLSLCLMKVWEETLSKCLLRFIVAIWFRPSQRLYGKIIRSVVLLNWPCCLVARHPVTAIFYHYGPNLTVTFEIQRKKNLELFEMGFKFGVKMGISLKWDENHLRFLSREIDHSDFIFRIDPNYISKRVNIYQYSILVSNV